MKKSALFLALVLIVTIGLSGNAFALIMPLDTSADTVGYHTDGAGEEWVLAWNSNVYNPFKVKLKKFKKFASKLWKTKLKKGDIKYVSKAGLIEYENPGHEGGGSGTNAQSVLEPATLFLLGVGLLGLSAIRRSRIKTGQ